MGTAMKYPYIFRPAFIVLAALLMNACVLHDENGRGGSIGGGEYEDAYFSLSMATRSTIDPGTGSASYLEDYVGGVRMVLYATDVENNPTTEDYVAMKVFDYLIKSKPEGEEGFQEWGDESGYGDYDDAYAESGYGYGEHLYWSTGVTYEEDDPRYGEYYNGDFITYARAVPRRDYKMLILINVPDLDNNPDIPAYSPSVTRGDTDNTNLKKQTSPGMTLADFLAAVVMDYDTVGPETILGGGNNGTFIMSNSMGLVDVYADDLGASETEANRNPIPVIVDRALAKVSLSVVSDPKTWDIGDSGLRITDIKWTTVNHNRKFYWMRKQTNLIDGISGGDHETVQYPDPYNSTKVGYAGRGNIYAEDPNFTGVSGNAQKISENFVFSPIYEVSTPFDISYRNVFRSGDRNVFWIYDGISYEADYLKGSAYIVENTMAADEQNSDVVTQVVVGVQLVPEWLEPSAEHEWTYGFFMYNGVVLDKNTLYNYYAGVTAVPDNLDGILDAVNKAFNSTYTVYDGYGGSFEENYLYDGGSSDGLYGWVGFEIDGLRYYYGGYSYYSIPIEHYDFTYYNAPEAAKRYAYGRYGVVRNNEYNYSIKGMKGIGPPVVTEGGYFSAEIGILDWALHDNGADIGEETGNLEINMPLQVEFKIQSLSGGLIEDLSSGPVSFMYGNYAVGETVDLGQNSQFVADLKMNPLVSSTYEAEVVDQDKYGYPPPYASDNGSIFLFPGVVSKHGRDTRITVSDDPEDNIVYVFYMTARCILESRFINDNTGMIISNEISYTYYGGPFSLFPPILAGFENPTPDHYYIPAVYDDSTYYFYYKPM